MRRDSSLRNTYAVTHKLLNFVLKMALYFSTLVIVEIVTVTLQVLNASPLA